MAYTFHKTFDSLRKRAEKIATQGVKRQNALIALCILDLTDILEALTEQEETSPLQDLFENLHSSGKLMRVDEKTMRKLRETQDGDDDEPGDHKAYL